MEIVVLHFGFLDNDDSVKSGGIKVRFTFLKYYEPYRMKSSCQVTSMQYVQYAVYTVYTVYTVYSKGVHL